MRNSILLFSPRRTFVINLLKSKYVWAILLILFLIVPTANATIINGEPTSLKNQTDDVGSSFGNEAQNLDVASTSTGGWLFFDDFSDNNYDGWVVVSGTWSVDTGELSGQSPQGGGATITTGNTGWTDYVVTVRAKALDTIGHWRHGIMVRRSEDGANGVLFHAAGDPDRFFIYKRIGGAWTLMWEGGTSGAEYTWYTYTIEVIGSVFRFYVQGGAYATKTLLADLTITHPEVQQGKISLETWADQYSGHTHFDEVSMKDLSSRLILHMNEGSGTITYDSSFYHNDGTIYGASWVDGKYGKALYFNGQNGYVSVPDSSSLEPVNQISVGAWVNLHSLANEPWKRNIVCKEPNGYVLRVGTGYPSFGIVTTSGGREVVSPTQISLNEWHHIVGTYDGSSLKIYVDGQLKNSVPHSGTIVYSGSGWLGIGVYPPNIPERLFHGVIDEVYIHNRALILEDVGKLMNPPTAELRT